MLAREKQNKPNKKLASPLEDSIEEIAKKIDSEHIEGFLSHEEGELLYHLASNCPTGGNIVEIGSWKGRSTVWMGRGVKKNAKAHIFAIDPHTGSPEHNLASQDVYTFTEFKTNIQKMNVADVITPILASSDEAAKDFDKPVDLLFIDGAHEYKSVKLDFDVWFPKLKIGGMIAFHDSVGDGWPGVKQLVREEIYTTDRFTNVRFIGSITYAKKIKERTRGESLKNKTIFALKRLHDERKKIPQPFRNLERLIITKGLQKTWMRTAKVPPRNSLW